MDILKNGSEIRGLDRVPVSLRTLVVTLAWAVLIAIIYFAAARLGIALRADSGVAVFWPAPVSPRAS